MQIILATTSKYRIEKFSQLKIPFISEASNVDEKFPDRPQNPVRLVATLAKMKAAAVARNHEKGLVIGMDTVGYFKGHILEKPKSRDVAFNRLKILSNTTHYSFAGVHMLHIATGKFITKVARTKITFRKLTDSEINKYLDQDPDYEQFCLGYDPEKFYSSSFVKCISGSYMGYIAGIPLEIIAAYLPKFGYIL